MIQIKHQNEDIKNLLLQKTTPTGQSISLPSNLPISLPATNLKDLNTLEEYLKNESNFGLMVSTLLNFKIQFLFSFTLIFR